MLFYSILLYYSIKFLFYAILYGELNSNLFHFFLVIYSIVFYCISFDYFS